LKKLMLIVSMIAVVLLAASPALAQSEVNDLQCVDFANSATQGTAQATYDADPSDPNGLDADGDGIACEFTESAGEISYEDGSMIFVTTAGIPAPDGDTAVQGPACSELGDSGEQAQQEAQALLNQDPSDPNGLDADGDGIPCEFTESSGQISYEDGSVIFVTPAAPPQTGDTTDDQYREQPAPERSTPVQPTPEVVGTEVLPDTGGASLLVLGTGALLVAGGLLARRIMM
jgi:hypothetical protein